VSKFRGEELTLGPGGVYPKNSAIETIERRRIAGEEAIEAIRTAVRVEHRRHEKRVETRRKNLKVRDAFVRDWYNRKKKKDPRYSFPRLRNDLIWFLDQHASGKKRDPSYPVGFLKKLRKSLKPSGKFLSDDALIKIVRTTPANLQ
jgi:hypothetical protein